MASLISIEPEIRARIWRLVLFSEPTVSAPTANRFAIFRLSKKFSDEAQDVFYCFAEFILPLEFHRDDLDSLPPWHTISRMKNVTLIVNGISGPREFSRSRIGTSLHHSARSLTFDHTED